MATVEIAPLIKEQLAHLYLKKLTLGIITECFLRVQRDAEESATLFYINFILILH
jgi:hypothetical protein